ncbi:MAG: M20/M25/M40 family metallo-hydrolase [Pirellulales bacterium]
MQHEQLSPIQRQLHDAVDAAFESQQVPWLQRLVEQSSHTAARDDVERAAGLVEAMAVDIGLSCTGYRDPNGVYADHRIYASPATGPDDRAVALVGHCDTVHSTSSDFAGFHRDAVDAASRNDRARGPGVLDMKSGLSVVLFAIRAIQRTAPKAFASLKLRFVCNTDEEAGSPSSQALFADLAPRTSEALVFEGGREGDRIITARKGTAGYRLTVVGREAHAGNDHAAGINAIHLLARLIPSIEALTDYAQGATANVGTIRGGTAKNTVPGQAQCTIDVRTTTRGAARDVDAALRQLAGDPLASVADLPPRLAEAEVQIEGGIRRPPMESSSASEQLRERYEVHARLANLGTGRAPLQGGGSDANLLAAAAVPVIDGLGPYGKGMHTADEWISLESLRRRTQALATFLAGLAALP